MSAAEHKKYCAHYSKLPGGKQGRVAPEDAVKFLSKAKLAPERIRQLLAGITGGSTDVISRDHFSVAMHETYKAIKQKGGKTPAPSQMLAGAGAGAGARRAAGAHRRLRRLRGLRVRSQS